MKQLLIALASAILVVLSVIAYDLHAIARELAPSAAIAQAAINVWADASETRAERDKRLQKQQQKLDEDAVAIFSTPPAQKAKPRR